MNKIIKKEILSDNVVKLKIKAPLIAKARKTGQFVIVKLGKNGERIPLTIVDANVRSGTITIIVQDVGKSSKGICALNEGDEIDDLVGPLGKATHIANYGTIVCACGGVGTAPMLPIIKAMKKVGNKIITILAAKTKDLIILEKEIKKFSNKIIITTNDGSYGIKGLVTDGTEMVIKEEKIDLCITIGPAIMMKYVSILTKKYKIPTIASLNTIMIDGTGMCGACRVSVEGENKFVCVDGPEFDAHKVNFDEMIIRLNAYK
ncbi:MAG: sulfide/dihydroorotate dehydrogenase-like FAD/NAD-binding protein [Bacteroidales bacterium OttesenSCG-928-I14]|jgi:ferredoxin--NADP+ reductase|nr:sulfide/dihydroorotate dehydrogenase-like FAD/NAD-binding protein [Bacteroidales bacterium OttesenSCG-928-I14]